MCALWSRAFLVVEAIAANWLVLLLVHEMLDMPDRSFPLVELLPLSESVETVAKGD